MFSFLFKHKEKYLIDFELIYVQNGKDVMRMSPNDFSRSILDYARTNSIDIKNISVNEPTIKSFVEVKTKIDYVSLVNFFLEPCNTKWARIIENEL